MWKNKMMWFVYVTSEVTVPSLQSHLSFHYISVCEPDSTCQLVSFRAAGRRNLLLARLAISPAKIYCRFVLSPSTHDQRKQCVFLLQAGMCECFSHRTCCTGVYFTVCVLSWLLMISKSLTASPLVGPLKLQSRFAFPAPFVLTVKWVGLFNSTPEKERNQVKGFRLTNKNINTMCVI